VFGCQAGRVRGRTRAEKKGLNHHWWQYLLLIGVILFGCGNEQKLTGEAGTMNWGVKVADSIMARWPDPLTLTNKGWEYTNGIILHGIERIYKKTGDKRYFNYIKEWVDHYIETETWRTENLDHIQPGILLLFLYEETGDEKYRRVAADHWASFANRPRNAEGGFWHKTTYPEQMWADGIYMAGPFLVKYGHLFGEQAPVDEAIKQTTLIASKILNEETGLLYHGWDFSRRAAWADPVTGLAPEVWCRGMAWYAMALVDMLNYLPESHPGYEQLLTLLRKIAVGIKNTQDPATGLWYQVMDKGDYPGNWIETSGSGMFIYALGRAVQKGYLDQSYWATAVKGWEGLQQKITVDADGQLSIHGTVEGMGIQVSVDKYLDKRRITNYPHGYCGVLMAASVME